MQTNTNHQVYAGFFVRLAAFLVDMIIVNAGLLVVRIPKWCLQFSSSDNILLKDFIFSYSVFDIVIYLITVAYFVLLTYYTGSTLGKRLFQLKVISTEDRKPTLWEIIYRESIGRFLSGIIMNVGYLLILGEKQKRGIHDLLADTCVIYYHEEKVYISTPVVEKKVAYPTDYQGTPQWNNGPTAAPGQMPGAPAGTPQWNNGPTAAPSHIPGAVIRKTSGSMPTTDSQIPWQPAHPENLNIQSEPEEPISYQDSSEEKKEVVEKPVQNPIDKIEE